MFQTMGPLRRCDAWSSPARARTQIFRGRRRRRSDLPSVIASGRGGSEGPEEPERGL